METWLLPLSQLQVLRAISCCRIGDIPVLSAYCTAVKVSTQVISDLVRDAGACEVIILLTILPMSAHHLTDFHP